ncbi:MAG TPA: pseudouridine synthase [Oligoflexia bacterium]|nr:pseudouridine synthase [Oligoflexia bacterium]HMP47840.1 pseudouridine synthase [Oligoflexia bacterium]
MKPEASVNRKRVNEAREPVRVQKLLASAGVASRRACEELIKQGRVKVNGALSTLGSKAIPEVDIVTVDGAAVSLPQKVVVVFNKPRGVVTTMNDPEGRPCVGDFLRSLPIRLFPVGRLDFDVSGLLVLTNDGDFANSLLHPSRGIQRKYIARVKGELTPSRVRLLKKGMHLPDGPAIASSVTLINPDKLSKLLLGDPKEGESLIEVVVSEGRNHFVKRILEAVGLPVNKLSRVEFGPFTLKGIPVGKMRQVALREELLG